MPHPEQNSLHKDKRTPESLNGTELLKYAYDHMPATGRRTNAINRDVSRIGDWTNKCHIQILIWRRERRKVSPVRRGASYSDLQTLNDTLRANYQKNPELASRRTAGSVLFFVIKSGRDLFALIDNPACLQKGVEQNRILPALKTLSESIEIISEIMGLDPQVATALKNQMLNTAEMDHKDFMHHIENPKNLKRNFSPYGFGHKF
ncbi:MAG: hypothetical protein ACQEQL_06280 [Pseudomonadota bacterium]